FKSGIPLTQNTYIAKVDYTMDSASKNTLFWRGNLQGDKSSDVPQFPGQASQKDPSTIARAWQPAGFRCFRSASLALSVMDSRGTAMRIPESWPRPSCLSAASLHSMRPQPR